MNRFDEVELGQTNEISHTIIAEDIRKFTDLTWGDNRLHTDPNYAAKTIFKKPVAHGMLGASFISTIIGTKLPGDGALWYSQTLEFLKPVRVGDVVRITAEDVAGAISFLASDKSNYLIGETIRVNGGQFML